MMMNDIDIFRMMTGSKRLAIGLIFLVLTAGCIGTKLPEKEGAPGEVSNITGNKTPLVNQSTAQQGAQYEFLKKSAPHLTQEPFESDVNLSISDEDIDNLSGQLGEI